MRLPDWFPGRGVQVIDVEVPRGVVPPSTSMGLNVTPQDKPPPPPQPSGPRRCTCNRCPDCGGAR